MVPDDLGDNPAIWVQLQPTKRPTPWVEAMDLPEWARIECLRPTWVFTIHTGRRGDQHLDPAVVLVDRTVIMPRDDPTNLGVMLQEGEECFGMLQTTWGHGTHQEGTMVEAD